VVESVLPIPRPQGQDLLLEAENTVTGTSADQMNRSEAPQKQPPRVGENVRPTTIIVSPRLNKHLGVNLVLASEAFQHTGSFKFRAAYSVASRVKEELLIAASSGNFGQALAYACSLLKKSCIVVMPMSSAKVKVDAVREYGGQVELVDVGAKSRAERVAELAKEHPEAYVASAYDDPYVILGNSSLGKELAALKPAPDVVVAPVGGGGLSSGIIFGIEGARKKIRVIGAEPVLANDAARSLKAGKIVKNEREPQTVADGARTLSLGEQNWKILQRGMKRIVEVPEEKIAEAVRLLFALANLKAEPTGALSLAAVMTKPELFRDQLVCCIVSGGNVDPAVYAQLILR
jgi:threonine dehydratase